MKRKTFLLFLSVLLATSALLGQNKKLTIEDAIWNRWFELAPEDLNQIQWRGDSYKYAYISDDWQSIMTGDYNNGKVDKLCTVYDVNKVLIANSLKQIKYFSDIQWLSEDVFLQRYNNFIYVLNVKDMKLVTSFDVPDEAEDIFYSKEANSVAYNMNNELHLLTSKRRYYKIAADIDPNISFGSNYVHRQEFGIDKGIFWSPKGNYIAFYRKDESMVADYPLIDFTSFPASLKNIKYPMAGQTSEQVTIGVYSIIQQKSVYLKTDDGEVDHYLTSVTWDPSENYIYVGILNREQNHLKFNKYDANTGDFVMTLFEEQSDKYVEPENPAIFFPKSKNYFLWYSQRDGYKHLYWYDTDGNLIKQVTKGEWVVTDFYGFSENEKSIYIQSTAECGVQRHIYEVDINSGDLNMLTKEHGTNNALFTTDKKYFINQLSSVDIPNKIDIIDNNGKIKTALLLAKNPLKEYKLADAKMGQIKAADGQTDLYYYIVTPPDMDKSKKYPVIVYVYGGPHAQMITDTWLGGVSLWHYYMAQEGYIVFTLDNRGSADRGFAFESAIFGNLGVEEMKDQMEGIKYLTSLPYVDENRIGVHGWSFGGFMTISLMTTYPDIFKVGVAGGPVIDWKYYEVMYGERYMDTPQTNPEGYQNTSILNKIKNLKGRLLVIHGGIDPVVVPQNSMDLLLKSQELGINIDFYMYPNSEHNVRGKQRIHLMQKVTDYFMTYL